MHSQMINHIKLIRLKKKNIINNNTRKYWKIVCMYVILVVKINKIAKNKYSNLFEYIKYKINIFKKLDL